MPGAVNQGFQRQTGLNAIDQLQKELALANGDPSKMLPALMRAQTLNPALERSGLGLEALKLAGQGNFAPALGDASRGNGSNVASNTMMNPIGAETQQNQPPGLSKESPSSSSNNIDNLANQYLGEVRPDLINPETQYGAISTFDSELKQDLTPEEESRIRQQLMDKYKNPNIVNPVIDRLREGIRNKYNESLAKYGFDKDKQQQIKEKWNNFTQQAPQRLEPFLSKYDAEFPRTKDILTSKYNQYAGAQPVNMTPEQMHTNAMALLNRDLGKLDALQALPSMPIIRSEKDVAEYLNKNKDLYKDLADQGFGEALKEDAILNKDMGNEEFHALRYKDQTDKSLLNQLNSFKAPKEYSDREFIKGSAQLMPARYNKNYPQEKQKYINDISSSLKRIKPKDDLVLARTMILDSGGTIEDFVESLRKAQDEGLELSEFQKGQLQEIAIPRNPPIHEYFNEKKSDGTFLKTWAPLINYIRGKR